MLVNIELFLFTDDKVDLIFEYKNNLVLNRGLDWLIKFDNEQLYVTSAVIIANYMRSGKIERSFCFVLRLVPFLNIVFCF